MKKKIILLLAISLCVSGCNFSTARKSEKNSEEEIIKGTDINNLVVGKYYIQHGDEYYEILPGVGTFNEGDTVTSPSDERVLWYKDEWDKLPTLYEGDSLIYYTNEELTEVFNFERFEDFKYSVGLCQLEETPSGRYKISTDSTDNNIYPDGDAMKITEYEQDSVIIDKLGGQEIRNNVISRIGTILGLEKDAPYEAEIYAGSELTRYVLTANIRILGSMEVYESNEFNFVSEKIINITIPEWFNNGYYSINGVGLFRYVKGTSYDENMDFSIPNINPEEAVNDTEIIEGDAENGNYETQENSDSFDTVVIRNAGKTATINITFTVNGEGDGLPDVRATITTPESQKTYDMDATEDGLTYSFKVKEEGQYTITYYGLNARTPNVDVVYN